jgi:hypothetical protein
MNGKLWHINKNKRQEENLMRAEESLALLLKTFALQFYRKKKWKKESKTFFFHII